MPGAARRAAAVAAVLLACAGCAAGDDSTAASSGDAASSATPSQTAQPQPSSTGTPSATPSTQSPTPAPATPSAIPAPTSLDCVAELPPTTRLGQVLMPLVVESDLDDLSDLAAWHLVGGATLLGEPGEALSEALGRVRTAAGELPVLIASDEEGGTVQRLSALLGELPSARAVATTRTPAEAEALAEDYGSAMAELGFGMVLAPVVDVGSGPGIGTRSYSDSPEVVVDYAASVVRGFLAAGVIPVLKHFPGHGGASADSHDTLPITPSVDELRVRDLLPYAELLSIEGVAVMVGHLDVPGLTEGVPASLSAAAIDDLLRTELGFDGLVITDSLAMGALTGYDEGTAVRLALQAGADMAIVSGPGVVADVIDHLVTSVESGELTWDVVDDSVLRILALKGVDSCRLGES